MNKYEILERAHDLGRVAEYTDFFALWMSFNTYYNDICQGVHGELNRVVQSLSRDPEVLKIYEKIAQQGIIFEEFSNIPSRLCEVRLLVENINKPNNPGYFDKFKHNTLEDFLKTVYVIRCNLFHGDKISYTESNVRLVKWAVKWLSAVLESG